MLEELRRVFEVDSDGETICEGWHTRRIKATLLEWITSAGGYTWKRVFLRYHLAGMPDPLIVCHSGELNPFTNKMLVDIARGAGSTVQGSKLTSTMRWVRPASTSSSPIH